jgi:serine/threonine-protein kinase HipA
MIVRRALFAWLIADGDMHLKNIALLKIAEPRDKKLRSVRLAPLYDAVTTRVFPKLKYDRLALKINGKDDNLRRADFRALATTASLRALDADAAMDDMLARLSNAVDKISAPKALTLADDANKVVREVLDICRTRMDDLN